MPSVEYTDIIVASQDMTGISNSNNNSLIAERRKILDMYFSPMLQNELNNYSIIRHSEYVVRSNYLLKNSPTFYVMGRRFLTLLIKISKIFGR